MNVMELLGRFTGTSSAPLSLSILLKRGEEGKGESDSVVEKRNWPKSSTSNKCL